VPVGSGTGSIARLARVRRRAWLLGVAAACAVCWAGAAWITGQASGPVALGRNLVRRVPPGVIEEDGLVYARAGGETLRLDLYRPAHAGGTLPIILHLHPGGWHLGDRRSHRPAWTWLAGRGYLVASADYRLAPRWRWPAQIQDAKAAVRCLRVNAARYHGDPARIGGMGESSGGQLVALLATTGDDRWNDSGGHPGVSARIRAAVAQYAPLDLGNFPPEWTALRIDLSMLFGTPYGQPRGAYRDASPVDHASGAFAPLLLIHGDQDELVPFAQSEEMAGALRRAGKPVELIRVRNARHNLAPVPGAAMAPSPAEVNRAIAAFFDRTLRGGR
jgi:acetyl esterase/lipase